VIDAGVRSGTFDASVECYPPCLASLLASCAPSGTCTQSGKGANQCYGNGVTLKSTLTGTNQETIVFSKNGKVCFTMKYDGMGGTATTPTKSAITTYTDPYGATVATEYDDFVSHPPTATVTCSGTRYALAPMSAACLDMEAGAPCTSGACP
jgi:hypothetical protein